MALNGLAQAVDRHSADYASANPPTSYELLREGADKVGEAAAKALQLADRTGLHKGNKA